MKQGEKRKVVKCGLCGINVLTYLKGRVVCGNCNSKFVPYLIGNKK